jgi:hypothetical protein
MIRSTSTILLSCLLAACGGGGGGGASGGAGGGSPAVAVDKTSPSAGDFYTYKMTGYTLSKGTNRYDFLPGYDTDLTTAVTGATATVKTLYGDQYTGWYDYSATLNGLYTGGRSANCTTTYTPGAYGPPAKLALNVTWDNSTSLKIDCGASLPVNTDKLASKGSVAAIENITVGAGTFQAYKLTATVREERNSAYPNDPVQPPSIHTTKLTSWIDVDTGIELKRSNEEVSGDVADAYLVSTNRELVGLSHAKSARQILVTERFVGPAWKGSYSGKLSGTCTAIIFEGGTIQARCAEGASTINTFFPDGTITSGGQVSFALPSGGGNAPKFTGQAESVTKISGTWSDGAGATGTWVFTREN